MAIRSTAVYNQGGVAYYIIDVFGYWNAIDCNGSGGIGCSATVYGEADLPDGTELGNYSDSIPTQVCGSTCMKFGLPYLNTNNPPHSYWQFTAFPNQTFTVTLYLCDGCSVGQNCGSTTTIKSQTSQPYTPGS